MAASQKHTGAGNATLLDRSAPIAALMVPFIVSTILVSMSNIRALGGVRVNIEDHRTTVSVVVQLLATVMGLLQMTVLTSVMRASFSLHLSNKPMRLDTVGLFNALLIPRISWSLTRTGVLIALSLLVIAQGPGALWAGALTPIITSEPFKLGSIAVPQFTEATADIWDSEFYLNEENDVWNYVQNCTAVRGEMTSVSNCPVPNYQAALLASAREASSSQGLRNHSKPDNAMWTYRGRSYGLGSSQGLVTVQDIPPDHKLLKYAYNETGYLASVQCARNDSSSLEFELSTSVDIVDIWEITGTLPNSVSSELYPVMAWHRDSLDDATVLGWVGVSNNGSHMIGVQASKQYGNFSNIQCTVTFEPTMFSVTVNLTTHTLVVLPVSSNDSHIIDIDSTGHLQGNTIHSVNLLARMSTSLYVSVLGETLTYNLETVISSLNNKSNDISDPALQATSDSFLAIIDDVLGIYGGAQLVLSNASTQVATYGSFEAVQIGQPWYQRAVLVINIGLLVLVLVEGLRTRWWRGLPCFDLLDFKSVTAAASCAGTGLMEELRRTYQDRGSSRDGNWMGSPSDRILGSLAVQLCRESYSSELAIVLAEGRRKTPKIAREDDMETGTAILLSKTGPTGRF
ncbi:hypothetical protein N0V82_004342 [Gnomoniopsis sp. IMI 355080]|nr:hypothetical protein N0V82_004342 [Gnomoniopsis sp. IMI 355080]